MTEQTLAREIFEALNRLKDMRRHHPDRTKTIQKLEADVFMLERFLPALDCKLSTKDFSRSHFVIGFEYPVLRNGIVAGHVGVKVKVVPDMIDEILVSIELDGEDAFEDVGWSWEKWKRDYSSLFHWTLTMPMRVCLGMERIEQIHNRTEY